MLYSCTHGAKGLKKFQRCVWQVAAEVAAPLSQAKKVTMVSMGKGDIGAAKLTTEVLDVVERIPNVVEGLTGVNITKVL